MAKQVQWLSDEEWARIEPLLPRGRKGAHRVDDRRVISGIVHMLKSGARWRDCPPAFGPYTTVYNRFNRWRALAADVRGADRTRAAPSLSRRSWSKEAGGSGLLVLPTRNAKGGAAG
ncbi:Putative transposase of IS4/5 family [Methylocapsa palsarum]|uniref:Putative transposase of IS4/5 family n=1 Tax=Methylocapsa palsarum TaxID=1612308 RepID=A0A1I3XHX1_9HYPH|nr:Putative transposase of IS4/5 family [Methylocapsa palsarum]